MVIVGAGGAGLSAAVTAAEQGKRVALLEQLPMTGGTYALSHLETIALDEGTGEFYDAEELFDYWMDQTEGACNEGLMRKVATARINDTLSRARGHGLQNVHDRQHSSRGPGAHCVQEPQRDGRARLRCRWNGIERHGREVRGARRYPDYRGRRAEPDRRRRRHHRRRGKCRR